LSEQKGSLSAVLFSLAAFHQHLKSTYDPTKSQGNPLMIDATPGVVVGLLSSGETGNHGMAESFMNHQFLSNDNQPFLSDDNQPSLPSFGVVCVGTNNRIR